MSSSKPLAAARALILASALAIGCHHIGTTDPFDTGNDAGASTDIDLPEGADPVCSATLGVPCGTLDDWLFEVVLDADALAGDGTWRFVDIGGYHGVLAERDLGDGPEPVVVFPDPWIDGGIQLTYIAVLPDEVDEQLEPVGITDSPTFWNDQENKWLHAVLAQTDSGYRVYGVPKPEIGGDTDTEPPADPTGLSKVTMIEKGGAAELGGIDARGITLGQVADHGEVQCVYGEKVSCGNGSDWAFIVFKGNGMFNALSLQPIGGAWGLAVGDDGRMIRLVESSWQVVPTGTDEVLRVVLGTSAGYYAAGENGVYSTLYYTVPESDEATTTHIAGTDIADLFWPLPFDPAVLGGIELSGLTSDDCAFDLKGTEIISCFGAHALDGPVIGSTYWAVPEVASGRFFLTEEKLFRFTIQED